MKSFLENDMLCGKYKGKCITTVLDSDRKYLEWCIENNIKFTLNDDVIKDLKTYFNDNPVIFLNDSKNGLYNCRSCYSQMMKNPKHNGNYAFCLSCHNKYEKSLKK